MERKTYYVNVGTLEISDIQYGNNALFTIEANEDEIRLLRAKMDNMHSADMRAFFRSHVPIMYYHKDSSNYDYDTGITEAYQMIYDLGNVETKNHITDMEMLGDYHL